MLSLYCVLSLSRSLSLSCFLFNSRLLHGFAIPPFSATTLSPPPTFLSYPFLSSFHFPSSLCPPFFLFPVSCPPGQGRRIKITHRKCLQPISFLLSKFSFFFSLQFPIGSHLSLTLYCLPFPSSFF
ncbi:hypothetical protein F4809DRAFT_282537 [Biscogniauxia mediterranea]|nr:hypothetical protein F4809DRAFT_282537 [Biscogniauxia mediterranea]